MKSFVKKQEGQSVIIVMLAMIMLIALLALVVDAGNAYVQRRMTQNTMDSGAQAGALAYAQGLNSGQVYGAIRQFVKGNSPTNNQFFAYYVLQDAQGNLVVDNTGCTVDNCTAPNNPPPSTLLWNGQNLNVVGVQVQGANNFNTFFAGVVGWKSMQEQAGAAATCFKGAATGKNLFPIAVSNATFVDQHGNVVLITEQDDPTHTYALYESTTSKNIGYLRWSNSQATDANTLATNMNNTNSGASGPWAVNDQIPGSAGNMSSGTVQTALNSFFSGGGQQVTMPVYGVVTGTQGSAIYQVVGFARFRLVSANYNPGTGLSKYITVKLEDWVDPQAEGGATNYGIVSCKLRPQLPPPTRTLEGNVKIDKVNPTKGSPGSYLPVDVVEILDTSGSMNCDFTGQNSSGGCVHSSPQGSTKIAAAISALTSFSSNLQPAKGDRAALVTFPKSDSSNSYTTSCSHQSYHKMYGNGILDFTSNITGTGGITNKISGLSATDGTPTASALKQALAYLTGPNHTSGNAGIVILATDGIANVTTSQNPDQWTGSNTIPTATDTCNAQAVQDAVDYANQLKKTANDGSGRPIANVFVVAVGQDFSSDAVSKIATKDTNPAQPHVWQATDAASMQNLYNQTLTDRVQNQSSECPPFFDYPFAPNVNLTIKNTTTGAMYYNVMTDSGGHYSVDNVQAGTFQIVNASVTIAGYTYNVFEDHSGGDVISNPTTDVGLGSGVYPLDVFLQTSTTITCAP